MIQEEWVFKMLKKIIVLVMPKEDDGGREAEQIVRREASPQGGRITMSQREN
jgi:hypothetical protein